MRKLISIWMTCTLLLITCMPSISLASTCAMPKEAMSHLESMSAQAKVSYHRMMAQKNHQMHMNKHMQTCRIECACGCHHQLDSLPHLLSPYMVTQAQVLPEINTLNISKAYLTSVFQYTIKVAVPPPNLS